MDFNGRNRYVFKTRILGVLLCFGLSLVQGMAQGVYVPLDPDYNHIIDRWEVLSGRFARGFHSSVKPYERKQVVSFVDTILKNQPGLSARDRFNLAFLRNDSPEFCDSLSNQSTWHPSWFGPIYKDRNAFYAFKDSNFNFTFNPVNYFMTGQDNGTTHRLSHNTRGLEMRGHLGKRIGFYTMFTDNQSFMPAYVDRRVTEDGVLMGETFWKEFGNNRGYDYIQARGYITVNPTNFMHIQFGYDKNQFGNGYRSLILGSHAAPYTFLKVQTRYGRFEYTNLFGQLKGSPVVVFGNNGGVLGGQTVQNKFLALHHLSFNATDWLNFGLFEGIMSARGQDTTNLSFDLAYWNPVIFYRSIEQANGSPDNAILGADFRMNLFKSLQIYGQFVLDEFFVTDLRSNPNSWRNKYAFQLGGKYINAFGINNLDLQAEYNLVRPFTYTHDSQRRSWMHYNQPIAHPYGANLTEVMLFARYQPHNRVTVTARLVATQIGKDSATTYGGRYVTGRASGNSVLVPYTARNADNDLNFRLLNGVRQNILFAEINVSYMPVHGFWFDLTYARRQEMLGSETYSNNIISLAFRMNIARRSHEF